MTSDKDALLLPTNLVTSHDLKRLVVELESISSEIVTKSIHERIGHENNNQIVMSDVLARCVDLNGIDIYNQESREELLAEVRRLKDDAPVVHITFATNAKQEALSKLVEWLREKIHPQAIIDVGLQPNLIGGAYVRTTNKVFDLSMRAQLAESRQVIVKDLEALGGF